ncbi:MAG TPA: AmmeMemoRadiSam system protein A [Candidatus Sulfomarinibacteraceae bacterium]|nr:AmmeMemoRadiSam system protein A [Candidatus Sulfomarinibacteraceae bacterium]
MATTARDRPAEVDFGAPAAPAAPAVPATARRALLDIARAALGVATGGLAARDFEAFLDRGPEPATHAAVFVTLTESGELRGCVGNLDPHRPIGEAVAAAAVSAALRDPRFRPVEADELPGLHLDISVLGTPAELADVADFRSGVHGVIVERGGCTALLLPEVATDHGWDVEAMLSAACGKAGLAHDAWKDPGTRRRIFATTRFGGPAVEEAARAR